MGHRQIVGIRYCGGCNPRCDRAALARKLERAFQDACFLPAESGREYKAVVVICGCPAQCASVYDLNTSGALCYLTGTEQFETCRNRLAGILENP